jgi:hypothetical protein
MNYKKIIIGMFFITTISSCNKKLDSLLVNPNLPTSTTADVDLYLNQVQLSFTGFYTAASDYGGELTRQQEWYGPLYANGYSPNSFDGLWSTAYSSIIKNTDALIPLAQQQKKYVQSGIARTLKAYVLGTLVDDFGDIPYTEANQGIGNTNPKVDGGAAVYTAVQTLLDSAIADFAKSGASSKPTNDLFYGGSTVNWTKAAKSLKLKFLLQTRLVDNSVTAKIQTLLTENNLINAESQDLVFKYATNISSPDARHPHYARNYTAGAQAGEFISNYFMWEVVAEKSGGSVSTLDPRRRYYFYRQRINFADVNAQTASCSVQSYPAHYPAGTPFCLVGQGYWGRDHGDNSGTPPDGNLRTTWGVYPAGGDFDANQGTSVSLSRGALGAGIDPIWLSSFTFFIEAEAALKLGITSAGTPRSLLDKAIRASMAKVLAFPATINVVVPTAYIPPASGNGSVDNYVNTVLTAYDNATTDDQRLNIIMKEYHIAAWGNGIETYNNYRRTGKPDNMQPAVTTANPGLFMRSFFYPAVFVNRNLNAPAQKTPGTAANKVFWDNNPDNFIK